MEIAGKVFLVTGAGSGLGAATARTLATAGAKVVLADVNREAGGSLAVELGANACFVETDVADEASAVNAVNTAISVLLHMKMIWTTFVMLLLSRAMLPVKRMCSCAYTASA